MHDSGAPNASRLKTEYLAVMIVRSVEKGDLSRIRRGVTTTTTTTTMGRGVAPQ